VSLWTCNSPGKLVVLVIHQAERAGWLKRPSHLSDDPQPAACRSTYPEGSGRVLHTLVPQFLVAASALTRWYPSCYNAGCKRWCVEVLRWLRCCCDRLQALLRLRPPLRCA